MKSDSCYLGPRRIASTFFSALRGAGCSAPPSLRSVG